MEVILVDENDVQVGTMEKIEAHEKALLHRAFSVFIFNNEGKMLLHKRAQNKYHSGGLWTNACCSHPKPDEKLLEVAQKRLFEEMGFTTVLAKAFDFIYQSQVGNGLTEHEFDHVFIGKYDGNISPDQSEVSEYRYSSLSDIENSIEIFPEQYTAWFKIAFPKVQHYLSGRL
ncbi:MAG: isopentenyl-diphosphate Delta-isomerase [Bacteroidota bacterium]